MTLEQLQEHKAKLVQQRTQIMAQIGQLRTDLDMLQGALQSTEVLIQQMPKEEPEA